ncbi:hypothetical protein [Caballeronia zhejiangensis]|uniref:Uncharacterized protein n=1 Tax=Caballeronia zhejiangensis TaxID=871203 RepID=A0A656QC52_9BURK|nr:hypothetical protein [Caballeronia zhejiangensis]KDR25984.1 hypothetical protein BG60_26280 [Caballeronia zhejiangensis]
MAALAIGASQAPQSSSAPTHAAPARKRPATRRLTDADRDAIAKAEAKRARKAKKLGARNG